MTRKRHRGEHAAPTYEFFATCPAGFEAALARELRSLGLIRVRPLKGRVAFAGEAVAGERACLWSRLASRIVVTLARFEAVGADELYEGVYAMPWESILRRGSSIAVTARGTTPELRNSHFTALKAKDAICDRLADELGWRAPVDTERPDARIAIALRDERITVSLDLSGEALFRRMPRMATKPGAPAHFLRPDYAALLLAGSGWAHSCLELAADRQSIDSPEEARLRPALVDPCLAGGGVAVEAAYMLADEAPGLRRRHWGFEAWCAHDADAWFAELASAQRRAEAGKRLPLGRIVATDADPAAIAFARNVLASVGLDGLVQTVPAGEGALAQALTAAGPHDAMTSLAVAADASELSLNDSQALVTQLRELSSTFTQPRPSFAVLDRTGIAIRALGNPTERTAVRPGNEEAHLLVWNSLAEAPREQGGPVDNRTPRKPEPASARRGNGSAAEQKPAARVDVGQGKPVAVLMPEAEQFANRLKKNARARRKWARREGVSCYRVYDADLPDYSAAIDLYEGGAATPGRWLVIAEYAAPKTVDPALAQARMLDMLALAPRILDVEPEHVFARARTRSRGGSQYGRGTAAGGGVAVRPLIEEGGLTFEVNFNDYLDTGIFLDHRVTRGLVREHARAIPRCRFLNLFAYTGTATCYAASAGAALTVTVDLSNTYLDWAERNMVLNGFTGPEHHYVREDVLRWIDDMRRTSHRWDLIFCDPPTFSNSAKMGQRTWDVQRDHVELLRGVVDLLAPGGHAIFSCNLRGFRPNRAALAAEGIVLEDITASTIPEDFARNQKIHHCYIVTREG